jgi:anti-anti-sigma factor
MAPTATATTAGAIFETEEQGDTVIVLPTTDLRELDYQRIDAGASKIFELLTGGPVKHVVLDFSQTDYYGSTALGFFLKLWKRVQDRQGGMAFCNVSDHEREILRVTKLDRLWPICTSRSEALQAVRQSLPMISRRPQGDTRS